MSEEREKLTSFEHDEPKDDDVEAHKKAVAANEEPRSEEESDDVEAHARRAKHSAI